jgi:hypothetical protein
MNLGEPMPPQSDGFSEAAAGHVVGHSAYEAHRE